MLTFNVPEVDTDSRTDNDWSWTSKWPALALSPENNSKETTSTAKMTRTEGANCRRIISAATPYARYPPNSTGHKPHFYADGWGGTPSWGFVVEGGWRSQVGERRPF